MIDSKRPKVALFASEPPADHISFIATPIICVGKIEVKDEIPDKINTISARYQ